ncbi:hypothetical protein VE01_04985 [Pseudogymnoascus verrucosus]|uniref:Uncharacterized protein n=1 Tax=Pseudogymnoascus verrucosus TaxID=342668 RepID=A0A1B8GPV0_9PEZI|nr:uncharacterized protein VE01_04985 [Pseudogymnoascus verrucosus]OBT97840.1 hypothetical protein VE01_04985 [Pseudogymnoascus verrucosus]
MECHRRGPKLGIPLDIFEHTEVEINKDHGTVTLISTEARIASNKLLLRTQTCILGPPKPRTVSNKVHALSFCRRIGITLCHGSPMDGPMDNRFVKYKSSIYDMSWECWDCLSDSRIDFLDFGGPGIVIVATRWFNLGSGMQPGGAKSFLHLARQKLNPMYCSMIGWSRIKFEALNGPSTDEITAKNADRLVLLPTALLSRLDKNPKCKSDANFILPGPLKAQGFDGTNWECLDGNSDWWYLVPQEDQISHTSIFELINGYGTLGP